MDNSNAESDRLLSEEAIVISGMSGLYPSAHNVKEFSEILYNKVNPVTDEDYRWDYEHEEISRYAGKVPEMNRFDSQFFHVHNALGHCLDPMARKILEQSFQAIYDAGVNPQHLKNKKVAVYIATSLSETESACLYKYMPIYKYSMMGSSRTMFANRISYWLDIKGPSLTVNEASCGSTRALEQAYLAIKNGECEAAIVGGCSVCFLPHTCVHYNRTIDIAFDGKTKSFDQRADGCSMSDAVNVLFLQKAKDALRIYAEIVHIKNEYINLVEGDTGPKFGFLRKPGTVPRFLNKFYEDTNVPPQAIEYVEALGCGSKDADKMELEDISEVFLQNRCDPVYVGSVTSNVGFTEAASGITSITKVLLGYEKGELAANLHYSVPRRDVEAIREGRLRIVSEHQPFQRKYAAINGMSYTGVNSHLLLYGHYKQKDISAFKCSIPYLVLVSGRHYSGVKKIKEDLKSRPIDPEEIALLHNIHSSNINGHLSRGYVILGADQNYLNENVDDYTTITQRPLWFVYSGMGSQWPAMGAQLMRIPIFEESIKRCHRALEPMGVDLINVITSKEDTFDDLVNCSIGIVAIQIGLTNILRELGLKPDGIIGHSTGEMGCAYADGCLTVEEAMLASYYRGMATVKTPLIQGSMAAVGLGYNQVVKLCPPEIYVACHNGPDTSTISGPVAEMKSFVAELTEKGIFAKEVACGGVAFHSPHIYDAGPRLLKYLNRVIKPKLRSKCWLSTSVKKSKWDESEGKYCSAEYFTNNYLNPVLFEETLQYLPKNAVLVEIAPYGLLQAILKRSLSKTYRHVPLTKREYPDNAFYLLQAIGKLYALGYNPKIQILYPKVQFPVSTGTPMLSHLIEWSHEEKWNHLQFTHSEMETAISSKFIISYHDEEFSYLRGHVIRGVTVFPFAAALIAAWDTLSMSLGIGKRSRSVVFHDVHLHSQPILLDHSPLKLSVAINRGNGYFEVMDGKYKVVTGSIVLKIVENCVADFEIFDGNQNLCGQEIYRLLQERDYFYSDEFCSIESANEEFNHAWLEWRDNWVTLIEGMLQLNILRHSHYAASIPDYVKKLSINLKKHMTSEKTYFNGKTVLRASIFECQDFIRCGGVSIHNIRFLNLPAWYQSDYNIKLSNLPNHTRDDENISYSGSTQKILSTKILPLTLQCSRIGDLKSLQWVTKSPEINGTFVDVRYAGLNLNDLNTAIGLTVPTSSSDVQFGMDFSGILESGQRVMGIVNSGSASTVVRAEPELLWPVPENWSLEDAATIPLAYAQALYCLNIKVKLEAGLSVFIQEGAEALGQAAISIALFRGCHVFTTVSDIKEHQLLRKLFPQLHDADIFNSGHFTFVDEIRTATKGIGCLVMLSNSKGFTKNLLLKGLAWNGTFLDIAVIQERENYNFGMDFLTNNRSYAAVDLSSMFSQLKPSFKEAIHEMLVEGIIQGYVRPLSRVTFAPDEIARAFELLNKHHRCGRVILRMEDNLSKYNTQSTVFTTDACQVIDIEDERLSMHLANRLVARGARHLYITCKEVTPYHSFKRRIWTKGGVTTRYFDQKIKNNKDFDILFKKAVHSGSVDGVYTSFNETNSDTATNIMKYLDSTSRHLYPNLKYFVVITTKLNGAEKIYTSRSKFSLPLNILDISLSQEKQTCYRPILDAMEHALCSAQTGIVVQNMYAHKSSLLDQVKSVTDISKENGISTLAEVGVSNGIIQSLLRNNYKDLKKEEVDLLTVHDISNIIDPFKTKEIDNFKTLEGFWTYLSHVGSDEYLATPEVMSLPTLVKNAEIGETKEDQNCLYIIPGIEGHHERFHHLCERLLLPALVLQPKVECLHETVQESAQRYSQIILKKCKNVSKFYLLGYETGISVTLQVASILEDQGFTGTVFCLGLAPDELQIEFEKELGFLSEEQLQDSLLRHMFTLMEGGEISQLDNALRNAQTWTEKVEKCMRCLRGHMKCSTQYAQMLIEALLARIKQAREYTAAPILLRSQLVLLRALTKNPMPKQTLLQQYSRQKLAVYQLRLPLAHSNMLALFICVLQLSSTKGIPNPMPPRQLALSLREVNTLLANLDDDISVERELLTQIDETDGGAGH